MAYNKHTWECGEKLTISKLNHIEDGIANNSGSGNEPFFVRYSYYSSGENRSYYDKTWQEVYDAYISGIPVIVITTGDPLFEGDADIAVWRITEICQYYYESELDMQGAIYYAYNSSAVYFELRAFNANDNLYLLAPYTDDSR